MGFKEPPTGGVGRESKGRDRMRSSAPISNISYCSNKRWKDQRRVLEKTEEPTEMSERRNKL